MRAAVLVDGGQPGRAGVPPVRSWRRPRIELLSDCGPVHWRQPIRLAQVGDLHKPSFLTLDVTVSPAAFIPHLLAAPHQPDCGMSGRLVLVSLASPCSPHSNHHGPDRSTATSGTSSGEP